VIQVFETTVRKESFCSGTEVPLVFQSLLAEAAKALKEQGLEPRCFQTDITVRAGLADEAIAEISSHILQIAKKFAGKQNRCSYSGGEISQKSIASLEDNGRELCRIAIEMTGG